MTASKARTYVPTDHPLHTSRKPRVDHLNSEFLKIPPQLGAVVCDTSLLHNGGPGHATQPSFALQFLFEPCGLPLVKEDKVCLPAGWPLFKDMVAPSGDTNPPQMWQDQLVGLIFGSGKKLPLP